MEQQNTGLLAVLLPGAFMFLVCMIVAAVMRNSWIGLMSGLVGGGILIFGIIFLSSYDSGSYRGRGR